MTEFIFHITSRASWYAAQEAGAYSPDSLASEGFIHCSKVNQLMRVANRYFTNNNNLVILMIDHSRLEPKLHWEAGTDNTDELFPHIYGPLNLKAVSQVFDLEPGLDGEFHLPKVLLFPD